MDSDSLDRMALSASSAHFRDESSEDAADNMLLFADALLSMSAIATVLLALSSIWGSGLDPRQWDWPHTDWILLGCGLTLWLCSQSLNNFKRLLPVWIRAMLGMKMGPSSFVDQSAKARVRRIKTLYVAALICTVAAWRLNVEAPGFESRVGIPFWIVVAALAPLILLVALRWKMLGSRGAQIRQY